MRKAITILCETYPDEISYAGAYGILNGTTDPVDFENALLAQHELRLAKHRYVEEAMF